MRLRNMVSVLLLSLLGSVPLHASTMTVDLTKRTAAPLKKGGLGSLFGVGNVGNQLPPTLLDNSILWITAHQGRLSGNGSDPFSTDSVAPLIRGTGIKMMCRLNDLLPGFEPYGWNGLAYWDSQVTAAIQDITANYADVVFAVEIFNEPDQEWRGAAFNSDPNVQGSTTDARINWLWTHTVQEIKAINPNLKIMGPNYQHYLPQQTKYAGDQLRMQNFLQNALTTGTMPDYIGWHSLYDDEPADIGNSLSNYRTLEKQLNIPNAPLPISVNEYGIGDGTFEGIPGRFGQWWGEMERDGIDFGGTGVYTNYGELGNTLRYPWNVGQTQAQPNGGWYMQNWYNQMKGVYVPVSAASTRYDLAYDGVASYDAASQSVTVILGGSDDDADIVFNGLDTVGLSGNVRVRVDATIWTVDPNQSDQRPERGGDPQTATYNILDTSMAAGGTLTVPIHKIDHNNGYRIVISPAAPADMYPTKYEAENGTLQGAQVQQGTANVSGGNFVDGIAKAGSSVSFNVSAPKAGVYFVYVRYATDTAEAATQSVSVSGASQGLITYPATAGGPGQEFDFATKRVALNAGSNMVTLGFNNGAVALDYIDVRPDTHRYEAEYAAQNNTIPGEYKYESIVPDFIGGINTTSSNVTFTMDAPQAGTYLLSVNFANGITGNDALDDVFVNGNNVGQLDMPYTGNFTATGDPRTDEQIATMQVALNTGLNTVRLQKNTQYSELDFATITPVALPVGASVSAGPGSLTFTAQVEGTTSAAQTITVTNSGGGTANFTGISASGDFAATNTCGGSLAAGAACQVAVTFTPTAAGARTGVLTLTSGAGPQTIALTGTGSADFTLALAGGSASSATIASGGSATYNLALSAAAGSSGVVQLACTGAPATVSCNISPASVTLAPGVSTPISVVISSATTARATPQGGKIALCGLPFFSLLLLGSRRRRRRAGMLAVTATVGLGLGLQGCGGGSSKASPPPPTTPPTGYSIMVSATGAATTASQTLTLVVQ